MADDTSLVPGSGSGFRRFDLAALGQDMVAVERPRAEDERQSRATRPGPSTAESGLGTAAEPGLGSTAESGLGTAARTDSASEGRGGLRGFLGALATGRISLLAGALGFLAQMFGQRPSAATPQAETPAGAPDGVADRSGTITAAEPVPTQTETRAGVGAYDFVNRLVGAGRDAERGARVEILFAAPFGPAASSVDQIA